MADVQAGLSDKQLAEYHAEGILRLPLPRETKLLCNEFLKEMSIWLEKMGNTTIHPEDLPARLPELAVKDRALIAKLYKVSRRFPAAKRIASDHWLADVAAQLMGVPMVSCCHFVNVRIDLPGEEKYLLPPHQDFPYIQGSLNGVTWWIPFSDTPIDVGPPSWIPGSHKLGMLKVEEIDYEKTGKSGGRSFQIAGTNRFANAKYKHEPVARGEALVFDTLLLHRSEPNRSVLARVNIQVRFDDPFARESFERNYPEGLYLGDSLTKTYPEYVLS